MKVFIIDDDPDMLQLLGGMLTHLGYSDFSSAMDGKLALQKLSHSDIVYDCILLDIDMPDINGLELCKILKLDRNFSSIPILMITASTDKTTIDQAFKSGATDYVNKPISIADLEIRLRTLRILRDKKWRRNTVGVDYPNFDLIPSSHQDIPKIENVENLIEFSALCNYLAHLSLVGLERRKVVSVVIDDFNAVLGGASEDELLYIETEVASAISASYRDQDCLMAYCGHGTYIVVSSKSNIDASHYMENAISEKLNEEKIEFDNGTIVSLEVSIGNPIRPNTSKTQRVRKTFDRAIARARTKSTRKLERGHSTSQAFYRGLTLVRK